MLNGEVIKLHVQAHRLQIELDLVLNSIVPHHLSHTEKTATVKAREKKEGGE